MNATNQQNPSALVILGIPFRNVSFQETVEWARQRILSRKPCYIATANMDFVMQAWRDPEMQQILLEADMVVADGIPIVWLSALLGPRLKTRVTGSDLVPMLARMARDNGFSIFLLGGAPGVPEKAAEVLVGRYPGLRIAGCYSPPKADILHLDHAEILSRLEAAKPDLLFVAFGAPKQEKWVNLHVRKWQIPFAIGVGGSLDFLAGVQIRAPRIIQGLALEWFWRMWSDPPRLFPRYCRNITFFLKALRNLVVIRCKTDKAKPSIPADSALRRMSYVMVFEHLHNIRDAESFYSAMLSKPPMHAVVLDMSGIHWLSSLEMGAILQLATALRKQQRPCILTGTGSRVRHLLVWSHLSDYLEVSNSTEETMEMVRELDTHAWRGNVSRDSKGRILFQLPLELTAANLDSFKQTVDAFRDMENAWEWEIQASGTRFVDSAAMGYFLLLRKRAQEHGISLRMTGIRPAVRRALEITGIQYETE